MKNLLLLLLFPLALQAQLSKPKYQVYPGEYNTYVKHPLTGLLYDVTLAGAGPGKLSPLTPNIVPVAGSAGLHHAAFIATDGFVYVRGDNANNIALNGKGGSVDLTKTPVSGLKQIVAYDNGGGEYGAGLAGVTNDGKVIIWGCTQSGFRGDGTEGNAAETAPYTVSLPVSIQKIAVGKYFFALGIDGIVRRWGGTIPDPYWSQFSCGAFTSNPNLTKVGTVALPEPIVDIYGGADWSYAKGKSGHWYAWGYDGHYFLVPSGVQQLKYFDITSQLAPVGNIVQFVQGTQAAYALNDAGDLYAWGNNNQGAIGNGTESPVTASTKVVDLNPLWVTTPTKVNPPGVKFVAVWSDIAIVDYVYAEDTNGNLWTWGRNKYGVLWNGKMMTDAQESSAPNVNDVLAPTKIAGFGPLATTSNPPPPPPPANKPPVAAISGPKSLTLPSDTIALDGSASVDPDGLIATYTWKQLSGPQAVLVPGGAKATVYGTAAGVYVFSLTVTDNAGASTTTTVSVTINPYPACPAPVVCPVCPAPRTVISATITVNGVTYPIPLPWLNLTYGQ